MKYFILFLEGIITFISPCILPMIPIYLSYFMGDSGEKRDPLKNSIGFVIGCTIIFIFLGAVAGSIGFIIYEYENLFNVLSGIILIIFGLNYIGVFKVLILQKTLLSNKGFKIKNLNFYSSILFGMVFAFGWTPCVGTFLGTALILATNSGESLQGILMLFIYSMGLGIPFIISAILIDRIKRTLDFIKSNYKVINYISGSFLIIIGLAMISGHFNKILSLLSF